MDNKFQSVARDVNSRFQALEAQYRGMALGAFQILEKYDSETARLAVEAHGEWEQAVLWFTDHIGSLSGKTPWECLAAGDDGQVRWVLNAIIYGIPA